MSFYQRIARPVLFSLPAEFVHHATVRACQIGGRIPGIPTVTRKLLTEDLPELHQTIAGIHFANPLGLAAGWDKSGHALRLLDCLGFGFVEIGSVSAHPSTGNPRPRLFRLPDDEAIVVNYGLPNDGVDTVASRLAAFQPTTPLGVNLVKTNFGPQAPPATDDEILTDYYRSVLKMHDRASYLMLNLSCPNAVGGKDFFAHFGSITRLLTQLVEVSPNCPVFLKVPPDPTPEFLDRLVEETDPFEFVKGICFNLPSGKPESLNLTTPREALAQRPGAVAGRPVRELINQCIRNFYRRMPANRFHIIGAGGIFTAEDAYEKICLGASLVQIYSALIYRGPGVVKEINCGMSKLLKQDGFAHIGEAIGSRNRS